MDTLAVQLTLPPAGCVEDFHLQVVFPATTAVPTAPVTALRAMPGAPNKKGDMDCRLFCLAWRAYFLWHFAQSAGALTLNAFLPSWQAPQNLPSFMSFMVSLSLPFFISNSLGLV